MEPIITQQEIFTRYIDDSLNLIGREPELIRKQIENRHVLFNDAIANYRGDKNDLTYPATLSINFTLCYGHVTAEATFGDNRRWAFDSDFWGMGFGYAGGAGVSVWGDGFVTPTEGEQMNFEIVSAQATAGVIQMFLWRDGGPILGSFLVGAGGAGLVGGGGTGVWTRK